MMHPPTHGASPSHSPPQHGWPPLHVAAFYGHAEAAEALLDGGADHSLADPTGVTALALARDQRRATVEAALRAAGAR